MNIQEENSARYFRVQSEREQTLVELNSGIYIEFCLKNMCKIQPYLITFTLYASIREVNLVSSISVSIYISTTLKLNITGHSSQEHFQVNVYHNLILLGQVSISKPSDEKDRSKITPSDQVLPLH